MTEAEELRAAIARMSEEHANERYADPIRQQNRRVLVAVGELVLLAKDSRERHLGRCPGYFFSPNSEAPELSRTCSCGLDAAVAAVREVGE